MTTVVLTRFPNIGVTHNGLVQMANGTQTRGYLGMGPYLRCNVGNSASLVHRLVATTLVHNPAPTQLKIVHHKNSLIHDNRACNLMWTTQQLNCMMKSNAKCCWFSKRKKKWYATCTVKGTAHHLGWFDSYEAGHKKYLEFRDESFNRILNQIIKNNAASKERTCSFIF